MAASTLGTQVVASSTSFTPTPTAQVWSGAVTTAPPTAIGFVSTFGIYSTWNCLTGTWYGVEGYGRCCPTHGDCPVYTACVDGSILANDQFRSTCSGTSIQTICNTGKVYESIGDRNPHIYVGCWPSWTGGDWDATRRVPMTATSSMNITSTIPIPTSSSSSVFSPSATSTTSPGLTKAALAALILGVIILVAISIGLSFLANCLWTRRKKRRADEESLKRYGSPKRSASIPKDSQDGVRNVITVREYAPGPRPQSALREMPGNRSLILPMEPGPSATQWPPAAQATGQQNTTSDTASVGSRQRRRSELDAMSTAISGMQAKTTPWSSEEVGMELGHMTFNKRGIGTGCADGEMREGEAEGEGSGHGPLVPHNSSMWIDEGDDDDDDGYLSAEEGPSSVQEPSEEPCAATAGHKDSLQNSGKSREDIPGTSSGESTRETEDEGSGTAAPHLDSLHIDEQVGDDGANLKPHGQHAVR